MRLVEKGDDRDDGRGLINVDRWAATGRARRRLQPVEPGSGVGRTGPRRQHPARLLQGPGEDGGDVRRASTARATSVPGDFARVEADGTITLLGRGSQCINSGGEKIYPEEVEAA